MSTSNQNGHIVLAIVIAAGVVVASIFAWQYVRSSNSDQAKKANGQTPTENENYQAENGSKTDDPYKGWESHANSAYGISFRYPSEWKVQEVEGTTAETSAGQLVSIRHSIGLKRDKEEKYNNTINVEVLNENLNEATAAFDEYFGQAADNPVTKTVKQLKGKNAVEYEHPIPGSERGVRLYLFGVGSKTYLFQSVNEESNVLNDEGYWSKFDKVFESFKIDA
jgi:hypothetical protein